VENKLMFWRNMSPPSSRLKNKPNYLLHAGFLLYLFFHPEDGGGLFLRNISITYEIHMSDPTQYILLYSAFQGKKKDT
jgi:hypothetical protein